jgi:hypothetical protein
MTKRLKVLPYEIAEELSRDSDGVVEKALVDDPWKLRARRYVLLADIMGFRHLLSTVRPGRIYNAMRHLRRNIQDDAYGIAFRREGRSYALYHPDEEEGAPLMRFVHFSDSVFIFTRDDSHGCYSSILEAAANLFVNAARVGIALRGAIARGMVTADFDHSIFFGQPISQAYALGNEVNWFGIVEHPSVHGSGGPRQVVDDIDDCPRTVSVVLPTKRGNRRLSAVAWPLAALYKADEVDSIARWLVRSRPREVASYAAATAAFARNVWLTYVGGWHKLKGGQIDVSVYTLFEHRKADRLKPPRKNVYGDFSPYLNPQGPRLARGPNRKTT